MKFVSYLSDVKKWTCWAIPLICSLSCQDRWEGPVGRKKNPSLHWVKGHEEFIRRSPRSSVSLGAVVKQQIKSLGSQSSQTMLCLFVLTLSFSELSEVKRTKEMFYWKFSSSPVTLHWSWEIVRYCLKAEWVALLLNTTKNLGFKKL